MKKMVASTIALLILSLTCLGSHQGENEPNRLLEKVSQTYRQIKSYHFESVMAMKIRFGERQQKFELQTVAAGIRPDRTRLEFKGSLTEMLTVCDGQKTWLYAPRLKEYTQQAAVAVRTNPGEEPGPRTIDVKSLDLNSLATLVTGDVLSAYERITDRVKSAKILRTETIEVEGQSIECDVVEVTHEPPAELADLEVELSPQTFWIDKTRYLVLRDTFGFKASSGKTALPFAMEIRLTSTLTVAKVGDRLPDEFFVFVPPEGAKEVDRIKLFGVRGPSPDLSGSKAVDFTLKDLNDRDVILNGQRGKVVLLNFWATWCGPCRAELPDIEKLHREFKDRGLVVLGISSESPRVVRDFVKKENYTFPTLIDAGGEVAGRYSVQAIPTTIIIDQAGTVVAHFLGRRSEDQLRDALKKIGLQ